MVGLSRPPPRKGSVNVHHRTGPSHMGKRGVSRRVPSVARRGRARGDLDRS
jgi:hypothetical protein